MKRWFVLFLLPLLSGCQDMWEQAKYQPLQPSRFFSDGTSARPLVPGVVAQESTRIETAVDTGRTASGTNYATTNPLPINKALLQRGRIRYEQFCMPCHGMEGYGNGMVVRRGFPAPPSYHIDRLRQAPDGHYFDVITNGYGAMYSYAARVSVPDRWAIAAYIRALQRSQNAQISAVPTGERAQLEEKR